MGVTWRSYIFLLDSCTNLVKAIAESGILVMIAKSPGNAFIYMVVFKQLMVAMGSSPNSHLHCYAVFIGDNFLRI